MRHGGSHRGGKNWHAGRRRRAGGKRAWCGVSTCASQALFFWIRISCFKLDTSFLRLDVLWCFLVRRPVVQPQGEQKVGSATHCRRAPRGNVEACVYADMWILLGPSKRPHHISCFRIHIVLQYKHPTAFAWPSCTGLYYTGLRTSTARTATELSTISGVPKIMETKAFKKLCLNTWLIVCKYMHTCIYMYVNICIHVYIHMYIYIYTHSTNIFSNVQINEYVTFTAPLSLLFCLVQRGNNSRSRFTWTYVNSHKHIQTYVSTHSLSNAHTHTFNTIVHMDAKSAKMLPQKHPQKHLWRQKMPAYSKLSGLVLHLAWTTNISVCEIVGSLAVASDANFPSARHPVSKKKTKRSR